MQRAAHTGTAERMPLFDEVVALFHRLTAEAAAIHGYGAPTAALRGVLRGLQRHGPQTVPAMARRRPVSRQHIQELVNKLRRAGLVQLAENPAHKRSPLVKLTSKGQRTIEEMEKREHRLLSRLRTGVSGRELQRTVTTLKGIRTALEGQKWRQLLKER